MPDGRSCWTGIVPESWSRCSEEDLVSLTLLGTARHIQVLQVCCGHRCCSP